MRGPVLIMAGGTGGHIFPGLAVAEALQERGVAVVWLGSRHGMEEKLVPAAGLRLEAIAVQGLRGKSWRRRISAPLTLLRALLQAIAVLRRHRPCSVLSLGGFVAGPGGVAAWLLRRPLIVHEQNALPGLTNRLLSVLARRLLCGFPDALGRRSEFVGNPVRESIAALDDPRERLSGRQPPFRLLVLGGSQGAAFLNSVVPEALGRLPAELPVVVRHQAGKQQLERVGELYRRQAAEATVVAFIDDMAGAYEWADLVICRAGALTVAELAAAGLGAIFVPYPFAVDDHQTRNAGVMAEAGGGIVMPEATLNGTLLGDQLGRLLNRDRLVAMASKARGLARPGAAGSVAGVLLEEAR